MFPTHAADDAVELRQATLDQLPADVPRPTYDRSALRIGIVHIGVGGFHRAHQAMYIDRLLNAGTAQDWAICGVGILPDDAAMAEALTAQDGLYTLVQKHNDGRLEARVIGSIVRYLHAPADPEAVVEQMAAPGTRIITLTVTEGGYAVDAVTGELDPSDPALARDLARSGSPETTFGLLTEALRRRRDRGPPPG